MTNNPSLTQDRIVMTDLGFYGYHGLFPEEKALGQRFRIDLTCGVNLRAPGDSDEVDDTVSYADLTNLVIDLATNQRFDLLEALAQSICDALFRSFDPIEWIEIKVHKPSAPVAIAMGEFAIQIYRERATN